MIWVYDDAIVDDLRESFDDSVTSNPVIRVVDSNTIVSLAAQLQNDTIKFPIVALTRDPTYSVDKELYNFTRAHFGVPAFFENQTNNVYNEKAIPISLNYKLTVVTTNTIDMDEIVRELLHKYTIMYFLTCKVPYEGGRRIRFGVRADVDSIETSSGSSEYLSVGSLYQTIIPLKTEGCVLISYTPQHLRRVSEDTEIKLN